MASSVPKVWWWFLAAIAGLLNYAVIPISDTNPSLLTSSNSSFSVMIGPPANGSVIKWGPNLLHASTRLYFLLHVWALSVSSSCGAHVHRVRAHSFFYGGGGGQPPSPLPSC